MIGSVDESGKTALMIASAENDSPAIAQMLIGLGAKILVHDHTGKTPVFEAGRFYISNKHGSVLCSTAA